MAKFYNLKVLFIAIWLCQLAGCTSPAGPIQFHACLSSPNSIGQADAIRAFLLFELERLDLKVSDHSDDFRELNSNESLIFIDLQDKHILPSYRVTITINGKHGSSSLVVYSVEDVRPTEVLGIIESLKEGFEFNSFQPNEYGGCSLDKKNEI